MLLLLYRRPASIWIALTSYWLAGPVLHMFFVGIDLLAATNGGRARLARGAARLEGSIAFPARLFAGRQCLKSVPDDGPVHCVCNHLVAS